MRLSAETRCRMDVSLHAHDALHLFEAAHAGLNLRESIDTADPRGVPAVGLVQLGSEPAFEGDLLADEGQLSAGNNEIPRANDRNVRSYRGRSRRKSQAELFQFRFDRTHQILTKILLRYIQYRINQYTTRRTPP